MTLTDKLFSSVQPLTTSCLIEVVSHQTLAVGFEEISATKLSLDERTILTATISNAGGSNNPEDYIWSWSNPTENLDLQLSDVITILDHQLIIDGEKGSDLIPHVAYSFGVTAVPIGSTSANGVSGYAAAALLVNAAPNGGTCSVSPEIGKALETKFAISCHRWSDAVADMPLSYNFQLLTGLFFFGFK